MNLVIRNVDPKTRGRLYQLQAERGLPNLSKTLEFVMSEYYKE